MSRPHFEHDPADPLLTTRQAAVSFGVTLRTIQLWCNAGKLAYVTTPGRHRRLRLSSVVALQHEHAAARGSVPLPAFNLDAAVQQLVQKEVKAITAYLDKLAELPTAQPNKRFWLREISAMIRNGEHKRAV